MASPPFLAQPASPWHANACKQLPAEDANASLHCPGTLPAAPHSGLQVRLSSPQVAAGALPRRARKRTPAPSRSLQAIVIRSWPTPSGSPFGPAITPDPSRGTHRFQSFLPLLMFRLPL
ncbi:hypothetical protein NDU88_005053 [Pleurodeles waltl]|uniref:Uncharacterized protein n=1 Tax=Pleurodeles waltl TaxID=8319 RepID=A0AAV7VM56_PLEWA|nr:hypothetical protein NDU88_005053 [Pleurodeles waltl]